MKDKGDRQFEVLDERLIDIQGKLRRLSKLETLIITSKQEILDALSKLKPPPPAKSLEVKFMFVVKDDNADVNFSVVTGDVTDAEGNVIPEAQLDLAVVSTDDSVVAVTFDAAAKSGSVHFGNPGTATVTATASSGGKLLGSGAADFTVTVGDPAAISGISLTFDGLTEAPTP